MDQITVIIVDDNLVIRKGLQSLLKEEPDIVLAGEASTGADAIQLMKASPADVVLMDIRMPRIDGIKSTAEIMKRCPEAKVLMLTVLEDPAVLARAILAGARGYLVYSRFAPEELLRAIRTIASGEPLPLSPAVGLTLLNLAGHDQAEYSEEGRLLPTPLTQRELEILNLIGDGKGNAEIATTLAIAQKTVKNHISSIYTKLNLNNRYEAIRLKLGHLP